MIWLRLLASVLGWWLPETRNGPHPSTISTGSGSRASGCGCAARFHWPKLSVDRWQSSELGQQPTTASTSPRPWRRTSRISVGALCRDSPAPTQDWARHLTIGQPGRPHETGSRPLARFLDSTGDDGSRLTLDTLVENGATDGRQHHRQIDAIVQRTGQPALVPKPHAGRADASRHRRVPSTRRARARIGGQHQEKARRIRRDAMRTGDCDFT